MTDEQDDLVPLMRAVGMAMMAAANSTNTGPELAAVRRKAEQYGAWRERKVWTTAALGPPEFVRNSKLEEEARDAYFAD
jgi:hypothetical protein